MPLLLYQRDHGLGVVHLSLGASSYDHKQRLAKMASASPEQQSNAADKNEPSNETPIVTPVDGPKDNVENVAVDDAPAKDVTTKDAPAPTENATEVVNTATIERQPTHSPRPSTRSSSVSATSQTPPVEKRKVSLNMGKAPGHLLRPLLVGLSVILYLLPTSLLRQAVMDRYNSSHCWHHCRHRRRCAVPSNGYHLRSGRQRPQQGFLQQQ